MAINLKDLYKTKSSQCNYHHYVSQGDLHKDGLGLSEKDHIELVENCHIILNCAASIDFNARLDQAI